MAVEQYSISGDRKRKRWHGEKKLIVDDKVEVRSMEKGFLGSWHQGTVVRCGKLKRHVEYDNLVNDITSKFIVDIVEVPGILDGDTYEIYKERGYIRPVPPMVKFGKYDLPFGLCVDVFHDDAWWEGVIFDHNDGKKERSIFFPDLGDEMSFPIDHLHLRITQDWNGATDEWKRRGTWVFLKLVDEYEHDNYVAVSVKQIWYDVRAKKDFIKIEDWTHNVNKLWRDLVQEVIMDYFELTVREIFLRLNTSKDLLTESSDGAADIDINPERNSDSVDSDSNSDKQLIKSDVIYDAGPRNSHVYELSLVENHFEKDDISNSLDTEKEGLVQLESISREEEISSDSEESSWQDDSSEDNYGARSYKRNRQGGLSTRKKQKDWKQLIISESKLCPESVHQYAFSYNSRNEQLMTTVREHIGCLGWKIEYIERTSSQRQYKYTAPEIEGKHVFMSLRQVCRHILRDKNVVYKKCSRELKSQDNQRSVYSTTDSSASLTAISPPHPVEFECKYCPGAVLRYYSLYSLKNTSRDFKKAMILEARKHLSAEGWRFQSQVIKRRGMLYISPRMRLFRSLQSACEACIREGLPRWIRSEIKAVDGLDIDEEQISQLDIKQLSNIVSELLSKNPELSVLDGIPESRSTGHCMTKPPKNRNSSSPKNQRKRLPIRLLRSSKRVQNERTPCPSNMKAQNVLSWLIDCNMLLPRSKVRYHARGTSRPMIEGRITRDGIKCSCCQQLYGIYGFGSHATGQRNCRSAAANIVLENGKSLLDLQRQIMNEYRTGETTKTRRKSEYREDNDGICTICHYGGELILCDNCPSSFHRSCIGLEDIPKGDWFCPTCCCGICCQNKIEGDDDEKLLTCSQCEHKYHAKCLRKRSVAMSGRYVKSWFCGKSCERIYAGLHRLLGEPIAIGVDNLKWTLLKCVDSENYDIKNGRNYLEVESYSKLNVALAVMHECFEPLVESYSGRDLVEDVIFSRRSKLNRLNFRGFYTVLLEKDEEVVTVANVRVYGKKVAEIPLVGTRFQHRRNGLCRILMDELEKRLRQLGVEKIVLPAVPSVLDTWTTSFGFSKMTNLERSQFLDCTFLDFQDTVMCQKLLIKTTTPTPILSTEIHSKTYDHQCSVVSEDQAEEIDRNETQDLLIVEYVAGNDDNLSKYAPNPVHSAEPVNFFEDQQMQDTFKGQKRQNGDAAVFKTYKRRKFITKL